MLTVSNALDDGQQYRLLELTPELQSCLDEEGRLFIKGEEEDEVVLCSNEKTFKVREIHSSNLVMLIEKDTVKVMTNTLLEAVKCPPQLKKLREWLEICPYEGPDSEMDHDHGVLQMLDRRSLFKSVQASDREIHTALSDYGALLIDGKYRLLSADYQCRFFRTLFSSLALADICTLDRINKDFMMSMVSDEFPQEMIEHLFTIYSTGGENELLLLSEEKICRFFANQLLSARPLWILSDLFKAWRTLVGDFTPSIEHLTGLALTEPILGDDDFRVTYFPICALPLEPSKRFAMLFECKPRWDYDTMVHYIEACALSTGMGTADLIVKYGRISLDPSCGKKVVTSLINLQ